MNSDIQEILVGMIANAKGDRAVTQAAIDLVETVVIENCKLQRSIGLQLKPVRHMEFLQGITR